MEQNNIDLFHDLDEMERNETIKILTFNTWLLPFKCLTVQKEFRFDCICTFLRSSDYDVIYLQEIWENSDYDKLVDQLKPVFPYSVYFHSKLIGSGVCLFCRWPLQSIMTLPFSLNGYPEIVLKPDWACGKALGYASTVTPGGFRLNLYTIHTHARYEIDHAKDFLEGHRLSQALEIIEFVKATAPAADAIFIGGDLNLEPYTTAMKLIKLSLNVKDAWLDQTARQPVTNLEALELEGCTCERADNSYGNPAWTKISGNGIRLDYILYRPGRVTDGVSNVSVECQSCIHDLKGIPESDPCIQYSDHVGLVGKFRLTRHVDPKADDLPPVGSSDSLEELLNDSKAILAKGKKYAQKRKTYQLVIAGFLFVAFVIFGTYVPVHHPAYEFFQTIVLLIIGGTLFALLYGNLIGRECEFSSFKNMENMINLKLTEFDNPDEKSQLNELPFSIDH